MFKRYRSLVITLTILSLVIMYLIYGLLKPKEVLPVYNPSDISKDLVDSSIQYKKKYHNILNFSLTNQNNNQITLNDLKGKIHIADFFFTTCPGICPLLTKNMKTLQDTFIDKDDVVLLSFSVTPGIDSVSVLKKYAQEKGVIDGKWHLLTGNKKQIYNLARKSYMAVKIKDDGGEDDMIHTQNFILVDKEKRIRGIYDGTDIQEIKRLIYDVNILESSYNN